MSAALAWAISWAIVGLISSRILQPEIDGLAALELKVPWLYIPRWLQIAPYILTDVAFLLAGIFGIVAVWGYR